MSPELVQAISGLGALGFAIIAIWAYATERVVPGAAYRRMVAERDAFRDLHASALGRLDRLGDATEALTDVVKQLRTNG